MDTQNPDFIAAGRGETLILIHSSVAGANQWRVMMATLADTYHVIAINLFGYGKTPAWDSDRPQTLEDQARLVEPFVPAEGARFSIVGHSFGASVAMKAAALFKDQVRRLVLVEPNPFYLLAQHDRAAAFGEATALQELIKTHGAAGSWEIAAAGFADYWTGPGSWDTMADARKDKFTQALKPNYHEWDAVMNEQTSLSQWAHDLPPDTTVISAADTVRAIADIVALFEDHVPTWTFTRINRGGHMAIMTKPDVLCPIVVDALA
jgi:pimeloyl-ACP methyl ester carboxylesterase